MSKKVTKESQLAKRLNEIKKANGAGFITEKQVADHTRKACEEYLAPAEAVK